MFYSQGNVTVLSTQRKVLTSLTETLFRAVLEKILLSRETQEPESALEVLHFRGCVCGMGAETAGRGVRAELALPSAGDVRHRLKGLDPQQHEQTSARVTGVVPSVVLVARSHVPPCTNPVAKHQVSSGSLSEIES